MTVNFWITPDEANLDPGTGGLVIWNKRVPDEWFTAPQARMDAIERDLLGEPDARSSTIPYRCNRAMLFNANVLHKSDRMHFEEGLANRRVSITMLFGRPGEG